MYIYIYKCLFWVFSAIRTWPLAALGIHRWNSERIFKNNLAMDDLLLPSSNTVMSSGKI